MKSYLSHTSPISQFLRAAEESGRTPLDRRGAFVVLAAICLVGMIGFVALSVDLGVITLTKTNLQKAADAAALAAAQEIIASVETAGQQANSAGDVNSISISASKEMARKVAELNGVYIDPGQDVIFGRRTFNENTQKFEIVWGNAPFTSGESYNVVQVTCRRNNPESGAPDSSLRLFFAPVGGHKTANITASAIAFVEARDIVSILDFSGSMNYDSQLMSLNAFGRQALEANIQEIYNALQPLNLGSMEFAPQWLKVEGANPSSSNHGKVHVTFKDTEVFVESTQNIGEVVLTFDGNRTQTFSGQSVRQATYKGSGNNNNRVITHVRVTSGTRSPPAQNFYDDVATVRQAFGLNRVPYPYQVGSWDNYINYARTNGQVSNAGYRKKYGGLTFVDYLLSQRPYHNQTADLWKTPHYPFHAMKNGMSLFLNFLDGLDFGDHVGIVTYDSVARVEHIVRDQHGTVIADLGNQWISKDYAAVDTIQRRKQAGHYDLYTGLGYGIEEGINLMTAHRRPGSRPTMIIMTDGQANRSPNGWSLPRGWDWNQMTDFDGDGRANYQTTDRHKQYVFFQAKQAIDRGYTLHTLSVGEGADRDLMKAIAFAGHGEWIDVPGGTTIAEIESQMLEAFARIAANVPPAKLLHQESN